MAHMQRLLGGLEMTAHTQCAICSDQLDLFLGALVYIRHVGVAVKTLLFDNLSVGCQLPVGIVSSVALLVVALETDIKFVLIG